MQSIRIACFDRAAVSLLLISRTSSAILISATGFVKFSSSSLGYGIISIKKKRFTRYIIHFSVLEQGSAVIWYCLLLVNMSGNGFFIFNIRFYFINESNVWLINLEKNKIHVTKIFCIENYKVVIIMRFILHESIVHKYFFYQYSIETEY